MKQIKQIVMPLTVGVLLAMGAQAQTKIALEGQDYVINSTSNAISTAGSILYEWYRNNVLIPVCTTATCIVPANLCYGNNVEFRRKAIAVAVDCWGDREKWAPTTIVVTFKCGGGHGTRISGTCWADRNVGEAGAFTSTRDEPGPVYQWNRNTALSTTGSPGTIPAGWNSTLDQSTTWTVNPCPAGWTLPSPSQLQALHDAGSTIASPPTKGTIFPGAFYGPNHANCTLSRTLDVVYPENMDNCIFLPAGGFCHTSSPPGGFYAMGETGDYWSNSGLSLHFAVNGSPYIGGTINLGAYSIRCVKN